MIHLNPPDVYIHASLLLYAMPHEYHLHKNQTWLGYHYSELSCKSHECQFWQEDGASIAHTYYHIITKATTNNRFTCVCVELLIIFISTSAVILYIKQSSTPTSYIGINIKIYLHKVHQLQLQLLHQSCHLNPHHVHHAPHQLPPTTAHHATTYQSTHHTKLTTVPNVPVNTSPPQSDV